MCGCLPQWLLASDRIGEPGYEKDTGKLKIGDGVTPWNSLDYIAAGVIVVEDVDHLINDVLQAGSGIALNFDDSNDSLTISASGLINNPTNNRILTSRDNTTTGINAESNFTYNSNNGTTEIYAPSTLSNLLLLSQNFEASAQIQRPRINLRNNRGSLSSPQPLGSGDFIGSLLWSTINDLGTNSIAAEISAYTPEGLSGYSIPPTQLRIGTRSKNGDISYIYVYDDGTLNPTAGTIINDNAKSIAFGNTRISALQVFNVASLQQNEASEGSLSWSLGVSDADSTSCSVAGGTTIAFITIPSGVSNSGVLTGHNVGAYRNGFEYDDNGSLNFAVAQNIQYGHAWGDSTNTNTSQFRGISLAPVGGAGTIQSAYDIFLANPIYDTVIDASGTIKYGTGTITNRYGIYQESADPNILNGSLTVDNGLSAPTKIHNLGPVSGNVSISYAIDKQIQTLSLNGTNTNFIEGSGWPSAASVDVLLEITVSNTTSVTWTMVDDFYSPVPSSLSPGKYLVLLRNIGTTMQGHYIGEKTN